MKLSETSFSTGVITLAVGLILLSNVFPANIYGVETSLPEIGSLVSDLRFKDIRALPRSLSEMGKPKAWVLVFTTTHCPLVRKTLPKLVELQSHFRESNVQFVAINVGADDTLREMAAQAIDFDVPFAFVKDVDFDTEAASMTNYGWVDRGHSQLDTI